MFLYIIRIEIVRQCWLGLESIDDKQEKGKIDSSTNKVIEVFKLKNKVI